MKIRYETITMNITIIDQMNRFLKNNFDFEFVAKKLGRTRIKIASKKITGTI